eukprot:CCRYP_018794-RA/>CCRYP_018794-RA protein AED:0.03 eAED:0.03 QI:0/0.66/0.5/1/0.66/0.75/4/234/788
MLTGTTATPKQLAQLHPKFHAHIKCPYADRWLAKGPEQAVIELGLDRTVVGHKDASHRRNVEMATLGSCTFTNPFSGDSCTEYRGTGWTTDSMKERCSQEASSTFTEAEGCAFDGNAAGYCVKEVADETFEYNVLVLSAVADCDGNKMACETFVGGTFTAASACSVSDTSTNANNSATSTSPVSDFSTTENVSTTTSTCDIAPGAIGAAHQAAFSSGYRCVSRSLTNSCPDAPAQGSPYMWPLKWAADYETQNMAFGSDEVVFTSRGRTFYSLDKNWKRSDTTYQLGVLRTIGQGPCDDLDEAWEEIGLTACIKNQTDGTMTTMLHKGNMMYFLSWKNDTIVEPGEADATKIEDCSSINVQIVGNIRPDWFLDARGDSTGTQYLGNQHVFYDSNTPKLVKQWRKKDFASQYFVMSMMENPLSKKAGNDTNVDPEDSIHWPLLLNIPGEGFGDDMLQRYSNHTLLADDDDKLFTLVENYLENGGTCVDVGGGEIGPPISEVHIPSNLEIDESFLSNEFTFSPFWQNQSSYDNDAVLSDSNESSDPSSKAVTEVSDRVIVESCFDDSTNSIDMSVYYLDIETTDAGTLPWMALGFRSSDKCAMTPPDGGSTPIILITHSSTEADPVAHSGDLVPEAKAMSEDSYTAIYQSLVPLADSLDYSDVSVSAPMLGSASSFAAGTSSIADEDTVTLSFKQVAENKPDVIYFTYAIGAQSQLSVHTTRECFEIRDFPSCPTSRKSAADSVSVSIGDLIADSSEASTARIEDISTSGSHVLEISATLTLLFTFLLTI